MVGDGAKASMLTPERLSDLFELPIAVDTAGGYYYARPQS